MSTRQNLLIDADDTLWHNNIYYEQGITFFLDRMEDLGHPRVEMEKLLRKREMENVPHHGYGSESFTISLREVYLETCEAALREPEDEMLSFIQDTGRLTRDYPILLLPGVEETLPLLAGSHRLLLLTKGNHNEQLEKVHRSGIADHFEAVVIVPEKNREVYEKVLADHGLSREDTWMVGNSPKSDINPAKSAGLKTVLIPYHATWEFELDAIQENGHKTVVIENFSGLLNVI